MDIRFAGFKADTHALANAGWRIAEDREPYDRYGRDRVRLLLKNHQLDIEAMTNWVDMTELKNKHLIHTGLLQQVSGNYPYCFAITHIGRLVRVVRYDEEPGFIAREIEPRYTFMDREQVWTFDTIFPTKRAPVDEVLLAKADMSIAEHLEAIVRKQAPKQKELRMKALQAQTEPLLHLIQVA